jgi:hypothetical protein
MQAIHLIGHVSAIMSCHIMQLSHVISDVIIFFSSHIPGLQDGGRIISSRNPLIISSFKCNFSSPVRFLFSPSFISPWLLMVSACYVFSIDK